MPQPTSPDGSHDPGTVAAAAVPAGSWTAVVLAGGTSRRWGGRDKTAIPLAGRPLLLHTVDAVLPGAAAVAVVAPSDHPARDAVEAGARAVPVPLVWTREVPPGGGPLAGLAAGLAALETLGGNGRRVALRGDPADDRGDDPGDDRPVVVLAGDLPFARTAVPRLLGALAAAPDVDAAVGIDDGGHRQPLLAAYRAGALRRHLPSPHPAGRPLRSLLAAMRVTEIPVTATESLDLDTPDDAATAARLAEPAEPAEPAERAPGRVTATETGTEAGGC